MEPFCLEESLGRPKGVPEFQAFSPKNDCSVKLYCRPTFWNWVLLEFDPLAAYLRVNDSVLKIDSRKIRIAIAFETPHSTRYVFSRYEVDSGITLAISEYAYKHNISCEILGLDYLKEHQVHAENLIRMLSYISKHRDALTKRNLDEGMRAIRSSSLTLGGAFSCLEPKFGNTGGAITFELFRIGRIRIPSVASNLMSGSTILEV